MEECLLPYIPERLHTQNKEVLTQFEVGELLYMRCSSDKVSNPYNDISITELSHNRAGSNAHPISIESDALFSIKAEENFEVYPNKVVCTIKILSLNNENAYDKQFEDKKATSVDRVRINLEHDPVPCMYPHSVFHVWFNDTLVTYDNYKETLKKAHTLRNTLKNELATMIVTKTISQT